MRKISLTFATSALLLISFACQKATEKPLPELTPEFTAVLESHGDWQKWYYAKAESYAMIHETMMINESSFVNLESREIRISNPEFEIGFDGKQTWVSPSREAYKGRSVKFYHNLYFYFFNIPFIFTDPGVTVEQVEDKSINGQKYMTLEATFAANTGASPEDQYFMLINSETKRLEYLLYAVSDSGNPNPSLNALKYEDYRNSNGVYFPRILTGYTFENDSTKNLKYQVSFDDPLLLDEAFDSEIFEKPKNGIFAD
ncbi:hypothetical protein LV84_02255 [Algoriphagus ratkowskyi]|uniref:Outer membrane lipoprotein-sorting protein n=1 Tax=Algoriphagus ratkowskyi TaxID=57028 RepID=A0A2W7R4V6_9BACT|nr:DUF6503 family protein [Algoriphagus ratkowskyi]PZX55893.1 hypothetical protein LV84_02255 [Algoriphagus ratkowskyi]TXD77287.1 hypothetical protein ESW18_13420 [Algoriphagus ratkowskyi]